MRAHEIKGDNIADPFVKLGRAFEIGEQNVRLVILSRCSTSIVSVP